MKRLFFFPLLWLTGFWLASFSVLQAQEITSGKQDLSAINVLLIDGQGTHNWRESTPVLKRTLEETGLFEVTVQTVPDEGLDAFQPDFSAFDVVLLNYCGARWNPKTCENLLSFVAAGGGLVLYHSANTAFPDWPDFQPLLGVTGWGGRAADYGPYRYWDSARGMVQASLPGPTGSLGSRQEFLIQSCAPSHPIMRGLPEKMLHGPDECYANLRGTAINAANVTILAAASPVSLAPPDLPAQTDPQAPLASAENSGRMEVSLAAVTYGKGRVFQILYGSAGKQCRSVAFIVPFLRGTQWAATGTVTIPIPEDVPTEEKSYTRP